MAKIPKHRTPPFIVPSDLVKMRFVCGNCHEEGLINWVERQGAPKESVKSTVQDGHWVPISFRNTCPHCEAPNEISAPAFERRAALTLVGDESYRELTYKGDNLFYMCIALVGVDPGIRNEIEYGVLELEEYMRERSNGKTKAFHAKDILTTKNWPTGVSFEDRVSFIKKMCQLCSNKKVTKIVSAGCVVTSDKQRDMRHVRDEVYSSLIMYSLDRTRKAGLVPVYKFDRIQKGRESGWAKECVTGIRLYPLFVWLSARAHIPAVEFIEPLSCLESKMADCLAYVTANEFARRVSGRHPAVTSAEFGRAMFIGYNGRGDLIHEDSTGYPLERVFAIK